MRAYSEAWIAEPLLSLSRFFFMLCNSNEVRNTKVLYVLLVLTITCYRLKRQRQDLRFSRLNVER